MASPPQSWSRVVWPVLLLLLTAVFLHSRSRPDILPPHEPLGDFPIHIGSWTGSALRIPRGDLAVLGPGHFMERLYQNSDGTEPSIDLFVAYFPKQTTGDTIHSPKHCLPGAGWTAISSRVIHLPWGKGRMLNANYYAMELGTDREVVVYWYQSHGRTLASAYWQKFYLVADSLRLDRTDGALVRVITPIAGHETLADGERRDLAFTRLILPLLGGFIPN